MCVFLLVASCERKETFNSTRIQKAKITNQHRAIRIKNNFHKIQNKQSYFKLPITNYNENQNQNQRRSIEE